MAQRGRPRTDSIPRFNVDTNLMNNPKFLRFRRISGLDERACWTILVRAFNYFNANHAITAVVKPEESEDLADFCWCLETLPNLYDLLLKSGFLEPDGRIHDQDGNQPLAAEIKTKREEREQKQQKTNTNSNSGEFVGDESHRITVNSPIEYRNTVTEPKKNLTERPQTESLGSLRACARGNGAASASAVVAAVLDGFSPPDPAGNDHETKDELIDRILHDLHKPTEGIDRNTLFAKSRHLNAYDVSAVYDGFKADESDKRGRNPFGVLVERLKNAKPSVPG